jgi:hypothetical protein
MTICCNCCLGDEINIKQVFHSSFPVLKTRRLRSLLTTAAYARSGSRIPCTLPARALHSAARRSSRSPAQICSVLPIPLKNQGRYPSPDSDPVITGTDTTRHISNSSAIPFPLLLHSHHTTISIYLIDPLDSFGMLQSFQLLFTALFPRANLRLLLRM